MTDASLFGVYTTRLPFLDSDESKVRPVIVVGNPQGKHGIVAVVPISSKPQRVAIDTPINKWSDTGLVRPSVAWVHRLTTVMQAGLSEELGILDPADQQHLRASLRSLLQLA